MTIDEKYLQQNIVVPQLYKAVWPDIIEIIESDLSEERTDRRLDMQCGIDKQLRTKSTVMGLGQRIQSQRYAIWETMTFRHKRWWHGRGFTDCEVERMRARVHDGGIGPSIWSHIYVNADETAEVTGIETAIITYNGFERWFIDQIESTSRTDRKFGVPLPLGWRYQQNPPQRYHFARGRPFDWVADFGAPPSEAMVQERFYAVPFRLIPDEYVLYPDRRVLVPVAKSLPTAQPSVAEQPQLFTMPRYH